MKKILIAGAGGAPTEGVVFSLRKNPNNYIIGMGSEPTDLILSKAHKKYYVPYANTSGYKERLLGILNKEKPDLVHFQNDLEIYHASLIRKDIEATGTKIFMPEHSVIDTCVHKYKSYIAFKKAGVVVPENIQINTEEDLKTAFKELSDVGGKIWLRDSGIGGGGKGALPTNDYALAKSWIDHYKGWGGFIAAEMLTPKTVTWLSIWHEGELVVAQTRAREGWTHGNRAISGITGVTKVGVTVSDDLVTQVAMNTVRAVSDKPHGIFGVDMAYDKNGIPNPTEINISRFFTTVRFFTEAGVNFPEIFKNLALGERIGIANGLINPLTDGLMWMRGMDIEPLLVVKERIEQEIVF
ncbi:carboxylate--amine ligase [Phytopseudomonas seleniipraecipitans]|uniref:Carbamoyl-phosphate synthase large subunit n=1 Tax=Phytopseudomonas seleniipraecipitans TaxID=640205 RepID=A0A1G7V0C3_9GAMM|nr:carboxylate--amine ligase [Pseudomonas seleniipraecipitans]SDG53174.1 carbamoyl-phosphate synthase large subunit [Pseudomonas seleniipraecipitans]